MIFLDRFPVFSVLTEEESGFVLGDRRVSRLKLQSGEHVSGRGVFLVLGGSLSVFSEDGPHPFLMRYLHAGDIFGVAMTFSEEESFSHIVAREKTELLIVPEDVITELMDRSTDFRNAYIKYLSSRIRYLNMKIGHLTAGDAKQKLLSYLLSFESEEITLPGSLSDLAKSLHLGRASLYRALDGLEEDGIIKKRSGNRILIIEKQAVDRT
ncbi:MAG: Crp/Fnr family transcriptional regulator [Oscillospiraceae bacterium]|nr:Crp/Fnr family transcriptional regulator [Oscillospiraceae bacterium]